MSRFSADPDLLAAEYAVLVRSDMHGLGLGWQLMQQLIDHARALGVAELYGHVLRENTTMLAMAKELGFSVDSNSEDHGLFRVSLKLAKS